jgi:hypothetical protein
MHKLLTIIRGMIKGEVSIDSVGKTLISKTPGDVTDLTHN